MGGRVGYVSNVAALGFGTTVVPGIALADPAGNGYVNYIIAHGIALAAGFLFAFLLGAVFERRQTADEPENTGEFSEAAGQTSVQTAETEKLAAFADGQFMGIEKVNDPTFSQKVLGDGVAVVPSGNKVYSPADAVVEMVADTCHAVALRTKAGHGILLHVGIDTVQLEGKYFDVHVTAGQTVKKGDCLLDVDFGKIAEDG